MMHEDSINQIREQTMKREYIQLLSKICKISDSSQYGWKSISELQIALSKVKTLVAEGEKINLIHKLNTESSR